MMNNEILEAVLKLIGICVAGMVCGIIVERFISHD